MDSLRTGRETWLRLRAVGDFEKPVVSSGVIGNSSPSWLRSVPGCVAKA
jgi:hypothetical protein